MRSIPSHLNLFTWHCVVCSTRSALVDDPPRPFLLLAASFLQPILPHCFHVRSATNGASEPNKDGAAAAVAAAGCCSHRPPGRTHIVTHPLASAAVFFTSRDIFLLFIPQQTSGSSSWRLPVHYRRARITVGVPPPHSVLLFLRAPAAPIFAISCSRELFAIHLTRFCSGLCAQPMCSRRCSVLRKQVPKGWGRGGGGVT